MSSVVWTPNTTIKIARTTNVYGLRRAMCTSWIMGDVCETRLEFLSCGTPEAAAHKAATEVPFFNYSKPEQKQIAYPVCRIRSTMKIDNAGTCVIIGINRRYVCLTL